MTHVAVLKGGLSSERDVSLATGSAVAKALRELSYNVSEVDVGYDVSKILSDLRPDIAFNAMHGTYGEDGCIQGLLEFLRIPYTHSGVLASSTAMHKPTAKIIFENHGIKCALGKTVTREEILSGDIMSTPFVIKPLSEGSSVGVRIIRDNYNLYEIEKDIPSGDVFLVEEYIEGRELSVAVLEGKAIGVVEIRPKDGFYNYKNKYTHGMTEYLIPAPVEENIYNKAMDIAEKAHNALRCLGVTRADIRYSSKDGNLYILEVNTHPGMTETSLVPKLAEYSGMSFSNLVECILREASLDNIRNSAT